MEHWKLPELRPSVGYQLYYPGYYPFPHSMAPAHAPVPTPTPASASANGKVNASSASLSSSNRRLKRIKKNHQTVKSRFQARLDKQERKNRALSERLEELKQCEAFLSSLHEIEGRLMFAESHGKFLEMCVQSWESAVKRFDLEEGVKEVEGEGGEDDEEGGEDEEDEEDHDRGDEDEGVSEEEEVDEMERENFEQDSEAEKDSEPNCSNDEEDY